MRRFGERRLQVVAPASGRTDNYASETRFPSQLNLSSIYSLDFLLAFLKIAPKYQMPQEPLCKTT
jgi:hypothetical protein